MEVNMLKGPLLKNMLVFTLPIMLTGVLQLLFNTADLMVVGRLCGSRYIAAVGATSSLTHLIVNLFIGFSIGSGVCAAHAFGSRDRKAIEKVVHTAIPTALITGLFLNVVGVIFSGNLLRWMNTPDDILPLSSIYVKIYFCGSGFSMVYNTGAALLRAGGDSVRPLIFLSVSGLLNILFNLFFVLVLGLAISGVALATVISQAICAILVCGSLMRRQDAFGLRLRKLHIDPEMLWKIIRLGIPASIQSCLFSISNVIIQSSVNSFGTAAVSGNAAGSNIGAYVNTMMNAYHQTAVNFIGQNVGAGQYKRVTRICRACLVCVAATGLALGVAAFALGRPLLRLYITDSPEAIRYGMLRLFFLCIPFFLGGMQDVMTGSLRGLGYSAVPMIISVLGICMFRILWICTIFQIERFHTLQSLYVSYPISWLLTFLAEGIAFRVITARQWKGLSGRSD